MNKLKKILALVVVSTSLFAIASCGQNDEPVTSVETPIDNLPIDFDHYYSDRISFADMHYELKDSNNYFMENGVAKLNLKYVTDGDTAVFHLANGEEDSYTNPLKTPHSYLTVRFLAIDTPESTSAIAAWGKKASKYVHNLLENAEGIIVDASSIDTSNPNIYPTQESKYQPGARLDNNGTRWLALIWYCPDGGNPDDLHSYRSLQLDVIEECYSFYTGNLGDTGYVYFADKTIEPKLYERYKDTYGSLTMSDILFEAELRMSYLQKRYTGYEKDPDYDYSRTPFKCENRKESIKDAYEHWDEYMNSGKYIALTGVITNFVGNNFYFEDAAGYPLYVYMGINGKSIGNLFSVGDTIEIRGRLAEYGGQKQMSDIAWAKETFTKITDEADMIPLPEVIEISDADFDAKKLEPLLGKLVRITRMETSTKGNQSKDKSFTLNGKKKVTYYDEDDKAITLSSFGTMGIRFNGTLAPEYTYDEITEYTNSTVSVVGILSLYFEMDMQSEQNYPSYQMVPGNRKVLDDGSLSWDIVKVD